ncbi:3'-5' exonuclease [Novosphingobium cyanobacteriorum]|uniref:3'-5' exonuclease n=1 Tax=Novosphingobium cyanobacteriorum TaxID=3024215 RepID=A0ABT6CPN9_9SPHN|nr:3'-5' exonuclease [Novosphingobium cyanobacteriorum]MDF8335847.1 3'-5' exonuclease [Novosphingobium cyanobacteriorum]
MTIPETCSVLLPSYLPAREPCDDSWDIHILRPVAPLATTPLIGPDLERRPNYIGVVYCEATSTDPQTAEVIDLAVCVLEIDRAGVITGVAELKQSLRDPGMPIPQEVTRLTGISDADVAGAQFDADDWTHLLAQCDPLVAHNAAYDAVVLERLLPGIRRSDWACSMSEIDWADLGFDGRSLGYLLMQIGFYNKGHRAMADVTSLVHLLSWQAPDRRCLLAHLRDRSDRVTTRVEARGAPFSKKDLLKARGYKWHAGRRVCWADIEEDALEEEKRWLLDDLRCKPSLQLPTSRQRPR